MKQLCKKPSQWKELESSLTNILDEASGKLAHGVLTELLVGKRAEKMSRAYQWGGTVEFNILCDAVHQATGIALVLQEFNLTDGSARRFHGKSERLDFELHESSIRNVGKIERPEPTASRPEVVASVLHHKISKRSRAGNHYSALHPIAPGRHQVGFTELDTNIDSDDKLSEIDGIRR